MEKALTIKNPWAYLIASGIKTVENRSRRTHYRGKILIHSSKVNDKTSVHISDLLTEEQWNFLSIKDKMIMTVGEFNNSSIIGEAEIVDCIENSKSVWAVPGQWHWIIKNAVLYPHPIQNIKGKLGIWNYDHNPSNTPLEYFTITKKEGI
ncbi:MAG: ASCH domain-containing protein [Bacteroidota bacterium]